MSTSKWYVGERYSHHAICVRERETRDLIAEVFARGSDESSAQLIASAPDLLAERDALRADRDSIIAVTCRVKEERDALRAVLREIVHEYDQTHDAEMHTDGRWTSAASVPVEVMERAKEMCK